MNAIKAICALILGLAAALVVIIGGAISAAFMATVTVTMMVCGVVLVIFSMVWIALQGVWNYMTKPRYPPPSP